MILKIEKKFDGTFYITKDHEERNDYVLYIFV